MRGKDLGQPLDNIRLLEVSIVPLADVIFHVVELLRWVVGPDDRVWAEPARSRTQDQLSRPLAYAVESIDPMVHELGAQRFIRLLTQQIGQDADTILRRPIRQRLIN